MKQEKLIKIQNILENKGYKQYSELLSNYAENYNNKGKYVVGFIGNELVGKSTLINDILEEEVLQTNVIPSSAEISISYDKNKKIVDELGKTDDISRLSELENEKIKFTITIPNNFLKSYAIEIKEFHNIINKKQLNNLVLMADIYKCNAIVLVMSAEHFLSELECVFINNYCQYKGKEHLLLVLNKLSLIDSNDRKRIIKYAQDKISNKFSNIEWMFYDKPIENNFEARILNKNIKDEIFKLYDRTNNLDFYLIDNILQYIKLQLKADIKVLQEKQQKSEEEIKKQEKKFEEQKELDQIAIDKVAIEFCQRKYKAIEKIDNFIKEKFEEVTIDLINDYFQATNKCQWYEKELQNSWKKYIIQMSYETDNYATKIFMNDIKWLNEEIHTKLDVTSVSIVMAEEKLEVVNKMEPYETQKKYCQIGVGGGIFLSYCLFNFIGAAISLGGGLLIYKYLEVKEKLQDDDFQRKLKVNIRDITTKVRKISKDDIEKLYEEMNNEFKQEAKRIIESKYIFKKIDKIDYMTEIDGLTNIIKMIEEN